HALAPHLLARHLHPAALADDPLVADALVLAAVALPVLGRTEDALAEQAVALRLERAVVDRLRLGDLARRPVADLLRRREPDTDRVEIIDVDHALSPPVKALAVVVIRFVELTFLPSFNPVRAWVSPAVDVAGQLAISQSEMACD